MQRLQGVLPGMPIMGGALQPEAWGHSRSLRGALFLGDKALDQGVVGALLSGPLQVDAWVSQGSQPFGQTATVTRSDGNVILELDCMPAFQVVKRMFLALDGNPLATMPVHIGLSSSGGGESYVTRTIEELDPHSQSIRVAASEVGDLFVDFDSSCAVSEAASCVNRCWKELSFDSMCKILSGPRKAS